MHFSTAAALVASLLAEDAVAAVHRLHERLHHKREVLDVAVTDDYVETVTSTIYVTIDWPNGSTVFPPGYTPPALKVTATTTSSTTTSPSSSSSSSSPSSSSSSSSSSSASSTTAASVAVTPHAAQFIQNADVATSAPTPVTTTTPAPVVYTTLAKVAYPAPVAAAASAPAPAVVHSVSTPSSSNKRGLAYNSAALTNVFIGSNSEVSWAYNWGSSSSGLSSSFNYVPLLWGLGSGFTSSWKKNAAAAIATGSTHLLAFNEPDLSSQANIGYAAAAASYLTYMQPFAGQAKLGSPAVTNGGSPMGLTYLSNFISACAGCTIDFVAIHWYDSASNYIYFKKHVQGAYAAGGGRKVWITEFGASGSVDQQNTFLQIVLPWLDAQDYVERYAYFMCSTSVLLDSSGSLSTLGSTYMTYTSSTISPLIA